APWLSIPSCSSRTSRPRRSMSRSRPPCSRCSKTCSSVSGSRACSSATTSPSSSCCRRTSSSCSRDRSSRRAVRGRCSTTRRPSTHAGSSTLPRSPTPPGSGLATSQRPPASAVPGPHRRTHMRIMTVYAHPADTITNCGGTLALHADAGDEIVAVILTHGGRIHPNVYAEEARKEDADPDLLAADRAEIIENQKGELRRAAEIVGIGTIEFLDHDDAISVVREDMVDEVAEMIAKHRPDVIIADYPQNPAVTNSAHTIATMTLIAALDRASQFLTNIDGKEEVNVKQVFLGGLPVLASDALSTYGVRNDLFIDITSVVGRKVAAMDCFTSQGYDGPF